MFFILKLTLKMETLQNYQKKTLQSTDLQAEIQNLLVENNKGSIDYTKYCCQCGRRGVVSGYDYCPDHI